MIDKKEILQRVAQVKEINSHSLDRMKKAEARDLYYVERKITNPALKVCDEEKIKEINAFWDKYKFAYKNNPLTQIIFYNQSGVFDPSFVGFGQQVYSLVHFWNNETFSTFRNKNYSRLLFPFLKHPTCYVSCSYGNYYDEKYNILTKEQAVERIIETLKKEKELIMKPALDSGSGSSIIFISADTPKDEIIEHINRLEPHFVCQEILKNHESFKTGGNGLNTMRVNTLIYKNEVRLVGAKFRMSNGKRVDNWDAGGLISQVSLDGKVGDFAITGDGTRYEVHPNGFKFKNHKLYRAKDVINTAIECHKRIPQQKYISWDFTVDEDGDIVFIEMNSPVGTEGSHCLGINSYINKDIAREIFDDYIYISRANFDWDYREHADYVILLKYHGLEKDRSKVKIPKTVNGKPVKRVAKNAFDK